MQEEEEEAEVIRPKSEVAAHRSRVLDFRTSPLGDI
jgi:hypothetical protein